MLGTVTRVNDSFALKKRPRHEEQAKNELANASVLRAMNHMHITRVFDIHEENDYVYTLMPWCGIDLYTHIMENNNMCTPALFHGVYADMKSALIYLHHTLKYCHGDVKLENIMCHGKNNYMDTKYKLCDFGSMVKCLVGLMPNVHVVGTRHYQAPEVSVDKTVDYTKTDLWSLGVVLYCMHFRRFLASVAHVAAWYKQYANAGSKYHVSLKLLRCDETNGTPTLSRYQRKVLLPLLCLNPRYRVLY
jgi:serine/threonine protein kinase